MQAVSFIRGALLASAVLQLLVATVLFDAFWHRVQQSLQRFTEAQGQSVPAAFREARLWRALGLAMVAVPLALWWYLGTAAGAAFVPDLFRAPSIVGAPDSARGAASQIEHDTGPRLWIAQATQGLCFLFFLGYSFNLVRLEWHLVRYRRRAPTRGMDPLDPSLFSEEAAPLLARVQRLGKWQTWVWVAALVGGNIVYALLKS